MFCCIIANGQEMTTTKLSGTVPIDPALQNLVWNRWETRNFIILSLDEKQGLWLYKNIERMKTWVFLRWGLPDFDFPQRIYSKEVGFEPGCMILCVPNKEMMQKLWRKNKDHVETRKDIEGNITLNFAILDNQSISKPLTVMCLKELENKLKMQINPVFVRGMAALNETVPQIRNRIDFVGEQLQINNKLLFSKALLAMRDHNLLGIDERTEYLFDSQAAVFCLMLRKEFGGRKFTDFFMKATESTLGEVYKFSGLDSFDRTFKRYMKNLSKDVKSGRTPDHYLQIGG
jgi:hypothetical protein